MTSMLCLEDKYCATLSDQSQLNTKTQARISVKKLQDWNHLSVNVILRQ